MLRLGHSCSGTRRAEEPKGCAPIIRRGKRAVRGAALGGGHRRDKGLNREIALVNERALLQVSSCESANAMTVFVCLLKLFEALGLQMPL
jgi:hypothetical protein